MSDSSNTEILIVRSNTHKTLFDVIEVDFFAESYEYLSKFVKFEDAVEIVKSYAKPQAEIEILN